MAETPPVPVIDLFAGPGGLGEGFSSLRRGAVPAFKIDLSIEAEERAHQTLLLRSFYRQFPPAGVPDEYYAYLRGEISHRDLVKSFAAEFANAKAEARCLRIGAKNRGEIRHLIRRRIGKAKAWVLIGGPPCQAYSLIGRSRILGEDRRNKTTKYEDDKRHTLYREYLRIIADHWPPLFIMENVRGLLSSKLNGSPIFPQMLSDLCDPGKALRRSVSGRHNYEVLSLVTEADSSTDLKPADYLIQVEKFGLPQSRHRIILLGVRKDLLPVSFHRLSSVAETPIEEVLSDIPTVRSGLSEKKDSLDAWRDAIVAMRSARWLARLRADLRMAPVAVHIEQAMKRIAATNLERGGEFLASTGQPAYKPDWFRDARLGGLCNHTTRVHMASDLHRYLFAASYAKVFSRSPVLREYPEELLPDHRNAEEAVTKGTFEDRFRVQYEGRPSTTITSHLAKDGHHYIHPDPTQCRSLTVREAARLQTFPDNYFFEGPRSAQYIQVGNAVPPLLACKIADIVHSILSAKALA